MVFNTEALSQLQAKIHKVTASGGQILNYNGSFLNQGSSLNHQGRNYQCLSNLVPGNKVFLFENEGSFFCLCEEVENSQILNVQTILSRRSQPTSSPTQQEDEWAILYSKANYSETEGIIRDFYILTNNKEEKIITLPDTQVRLTTAVIRTGVSFFNFNTSSEVYNPSIDGSSNWSVTVYPEEGTTFYEVIGDTSGSNSTSYQATSGSGSSRISEFFNGFSVISNGPVRVEGVASTSATISVETSPPSNVEITGSSTISINWKSNFGEPFANGNFTGFFASATVAINSPDAPSSGNDSDTNSVFLNREDGGLNDPGIYTLVESDSKGGHHESAVHFPPRNRTFPVVMIKQPTYNQVTYYVNYSGDVSLNLEELKVGSTTSLSSFSDTTELGESKSFSFSLKGNMWIRLQSSSGQATVLNNSIPVSLLNSSPFKSVGGEVLFLYLSSATQTDEPGSIITPTVYENFSSIYYGKYNRLRRYDYPNIPTDSYSNPRPSMFSYESTVRFLQKIQSGNISGNLYDCDNSVFSNAPLSTFNYRMSKNILRNKIHLVGDGLFNDSAILEEKLKDEGAARSVNTLVTTSSYNENTCGITFEKTTSIRLKKVNPNVKIEGIAVNPNKF